MHLSNLVSTICLFALTVPTVAAGPLDARALAAKKPTSRDAHLPTTHTTSAKHHKAAKHTSTSSRKHNSKPSKKHSSTSTKKHKSGTSTIVTGDSEATSTKRASNYKFPASFKLQAIDEKPAVNMTFVETGESFEGFNLGSNATTLFSYSTETKHIYSGGLALANDITSSPAKVVLIDSSTVTATQSLLTCTASDVGILACTDESFQSFRALADGTAYILQMTSVGGYLKLKVVADEVDLTA